jgi:hypothetical protein
LSFVAGSSFFFFDLFCGGLFLLMLGVGFIYEWRTGTLDWSLRLLAPVTVRENQGKAKFEETK